MSKIQTKLHILVGKGFIHKPKTFLEKWQIDKTQIPTLKKINNRKIYVISEENKNKFQKKRIAATGSGRTQKWVIALLNTNSLCFYRFGK
jgi:hypothetical protein